MIELRAMEKIAEAHRRDLAEYSRGKRAAQSAARSGRPGSQHRADAAPDPAMHRSATGLPVTGGRTVRRPVGQHLGALLIRAGVRLGGTRISAS